jgi:hypothetical protein
LKSDFLIIAGSVAGPTKRAIGVRQPTRKQPVSRHNLEAIDYIASAPGKDVSIVDEGTKAQKVVAREEKKEAKKSVDDEILAAAKGEEHREKKKEH